MPPDAFREHWLRRRRYRQAAARKSHDAHRTAGPWIRVGTTGKWGLAIDKSAGAHFYDQDFARELSAGTDVALFSGTMGSLF
jgi:hypothetical protein